MNSHSRKFGEVPFYDYFVNIYFQTGGVTMGSGLSLIFRNFYMSDLEKKICNSVKKLSIYQRYANNILILVYDINEKNIRRDTVRKNSVLNFIQELKKNNRISFQMFSLILTIIITSLLLLTKKTLIITYVPSILKVNALSDIGKHLLII